MSLTAEQLALRKTGITSTDITRIVGESPFGTACDVYLEKITNDPEPRKGTIAQRIGDYLEPLVCDLVAEQFADRLEGKMSRGDTLQHPLLPWALATPDRIVRAGRYPRAVVEAKVKSVLFRDRELWEDEDAPPAFVHVQCEWHMTITKTPVCYVGALLGATPRFWVVEHDEMLSATLLEAGQEFHERHVLARLPPPVDGSEGARKMLAAAWPHARKGTGIRASPEVEQAARCYFEAHRSAKSAAAAKELAAQELIAYAGDNEVVVGDGWRLTLSDRAEAEVPAYTRRGYRHFDLRPVSARKGRAA